MDLQWQEKEAPTSTWAARYSGDFEQAMEFLAASQAKRDESLREEEEARKEKEARRQRELEDARTLAAERQKAAKRLGRLSLGLTVVVMLAIAAGVYAWNQQQDAEAA